MSTIQRSQGPNFANSLEWVKAGCPSPMAEVSSSMGASSPAMAEELPKLVTTLVLDGPLVQIVFGAAAVLAVGKALTYNPNKSDSELIMVDGRWEMKPEEEEEEGPKDWENSDEGTRYGGVFKARTDSIRYKKVEEKLA